MTTRWIPPALGTLALACVSGGAHAAWGHSVHAHVRAYQHLEAFAAPGTGSPGPVASKPFVPKPTTIRAFDENNAEEPAAPQVRKARCPDGAPGMAAART